MYSARNLGRRLGSTATSSSRAVPARSLSSTIERIQFIADEFQVLSPLSAVLGQGSDKGPRTTDHGLPSSACEPLESQLQELGKVFRWPRPRNRIHRAFGFGLAVAEVDESGKDIVSRDRGGCRGLRLGGELRGLLRQLQDHPLGGFLADT